MATIFAITVWLFFQQAFIVSFQDKPLLLREVLTFGSFDHAAHLTVTSTRSILVVDRSRNEVAVFESPTSSPHTIGGFGWGETSFDEPTSAVSDGLNLFVADRGNHRIQRFDRNLTLISSLYKRDTSLVRGRFGYPDGVALARHGDLAILDGENVRVVMYSGDFRFIRSFGDVEGGEKMLSKPLDVVIDDQDQIYVLEPDRIVEFDYFGNYLRSVGAGLISDARGFAVSQSLFAVVSPDTLWILKRDGEVAASMARTNIFTSRSMTDLTDVEWDGDLMYVLTKHAAYQFEFLEKVD